ncbi:MAG TPA: hypothetical protein VK961_03115 [Chthoniobacter sp.]|nr:hypothetical protein [Chthoniobacter sp.]
MNIELTTNEDGAEVRQMISAWTDSLLRQRSRPSRVQPRGHEWRFASAPAWDSQNPCPPMPRFSAAETGCER